MTENVERFIAANEKSRVVSGAAYERGGGSYTLEDGRRFVFTLAEIQSMPKPKWCFE